MTTLGPRTFSVEVNGPLTNRFIALLTLVVARSRIVVWNIWRKTRPFITLPALLLLFSGIALAIIPPSSVPLEVKLTGERQVAGDLLVSLQPARAELRFENQIGSRDNGTWDFGSFQVQKNGGNVIVRDNQEPASQPSELSFPFRTGTSIIIFGDGQVEVQEGVKKVRQVADFSTVVSQFPLVTGDWKPAVSLVVPDNQIKQGWFRLAALAVSAFALILLTSLAFSWFQEAGGVHWAYPSLSTVVVGIGAVSSAFFAPSQYDEGWILHRSESFISRGYFGNIYSVADASLVQGNWLEALYSLGIFLGMEHIHFRILLILVNVLNWILLRRVILHLVKGAGFDLWRRRAEFSAAISFVIVNFGFSASMRPESILALLFTFLLVCLLHFFQTHNPVWLLFASVSSAISITVHQSALAFLPPIGIAFMYFGVRNFRNLRREERVSRLRDISRILLISFSVSLVLLHLFQDFSSLSQNYALWSRSEFHQFGGFAGELERYREMLEHGGARWALAAGVIGFSAISLVGAILRKEHRFFLIAAGLAPLGLFLTASKWPWHVAVMLASGALFWASLAVLIGIVSQRFIHRRFLVVVVIALSFGFLLRGAVPIETKENLAYLLAQVMERALPEIFKTFVARNYEWLDAGLLTTVLAISISGGLLLSFGIQIGSAITASVLLAAVFFGLWEDIPREQAGLDWFQPRDRVAQLMKGGPVGSCGLYSDSLAVSSISTLGHSETLQGSLRSILDAVEGEKTKSLIEDSPNLIESDYQDEGEIGARSIQQVFSLNGRPAGANYGLWFFGTGEHTPEVVVEFLGSSREVIQRESFYLGRTEGWEIRVFQSTYDVRFLRVTAPLPEPGLFLVSPVFQIEFSPAADTLKGENYFEGPSKFQFSSCAEKFVVRGRVISDVNYASGESLGRILGSTKKLIQVSFPQGPKIFSWNPRVSVSQESCASCDGAKR